MRGIDSPCWVRYSLRCTSDNSKTLASYTYSARIRSFSRTEWKRIDQALLALFIAPSPIEEFDDLKILLIRAPLSQRKSRIDEGAADHLGVFFGNAAGARCVVPGQFDLLLHVVDDLLCFGAVEQKPCMLREDVIRIGVTTLITAIEGEIAALLAHGWLRSTIQPFEQRGLCKSSANE